MKSKPVNQAGSDAGKGTFLLSSAAKGQTVRLVRIDAGKKLIHRLTELGLTPGVELTLVHDSGGPLLLSVRDSRVAVGRGMAEKLHVADLIKL
jgi:Fe2+ transport system protein FeoA